MLQKKWNYLSCLSVERLLQNFVIRKDNQRLCHQKCILQAFIQLSNTQLTQILVFSPGFYSISDTCWLLKVDIFVLLSSFLVNTVDVLVYL